MLTLLPRRHRPSRRHERRRPAPRSGCRRGVSLPELLVVMAVVGVLGLVVVPSIEIVRFRMDGAARGSMAALVSAQRLAVQRQHDVTVAFDTARVRLLIHEDGNNNGVRDAGERVRRVALDEGVRFGPGAASALASQPEVVSFDEAFDGLPAFRFLRNGSASQEGGFYLTSGRSAAGGGYAEDGRAVRVDRATGRVVWYHYEDAEWKPGF